MPKTPSKMHMYDMVKIDAIAFKAPPPPPPRIVNCLKDPGSDRVKRNYVTMYIRCDWSRHSD